MIPYLLNVITDFPEELGASALSPATDHIFKVRHENEARYLPEEQPQQFHRTVSQLFLLSEWARRDIQTDVGFLTTRVKKPYGDHWFKLRRVINISRVILV